MRSSTLISAWFDRWASRRAPRAAKVRLRHRAIYVLPTWQGAGFLVVIALLWVLGTNYNNNLVLATAFLLFSLMTVSIVPAFRNLSGLGLSVVRSHAAFAGEHVEFEVLVEAAPRTAHEALRLYWEKDLPLTVDIPTGGEHQLRLAHRARYRGWLVPGRLRVDSVYPLGFFRVWSWVYPQAEALIYPTPRAGETPPQSYANPEEGQRLSDDNQEEFQGFRRYQEGAPLAHVAWKVLARERGLFLKDFRGYQSEQVWLDWEALAGLDQESRLSRLCFWAVEYGKTRAEYGLRLPGLTLSPGRGVGHQTDVLRALAQFGLPGRQHG